MEQRYVIWLRYDGTAYHGWQVQPHSVSVQAMLERALQTLLGHETAVVGAGRTDAGVHARSMAAHFDGETGLDTRQLAYRMNRLLPRDIVIDRIDAVPSAFHARFSATARTYHYYIHRQKDPFLRHHSYELRYELDFDLMNEAALRLLSVHDFGAFCKAGSDVQTTLCHVTEARWQPVPTLFSAIGESPETWCFVITANRFLRNMVRAVVGTLIEVGRHRMTLEAFDAVVAGKNRSAAGESVPGHALYLWAVEYDPALLSLPPSSSPLHP